MADVKHVGRIKKTGRKCLVVFRVLPNDPEHCLVLTTENLGPADHDSVINFVESNAAQTANELGEAMQRAMLSDGSVMLARFHTTGQFSRVKTTEVEMTPNATTSILLSELNSAIASNLGVTVADLALGTKDNTQVETIATSQDISPNVQDNVVAESQVANIDQPLSDEQLAAQFRSQADAMFKEAKRLREQAEELVPTKKKSKADA